MADLGRLLLLQLPVRCRSCQLRSFAFLPAVLRIRREAKLRHRERTERGIQTSSGQDS